MPSSGEGPFQEEDQDGEWRFDVVRRRWRRDRNPGGGDDDDEVGDVDMDEEEDGFEILDGMTSQSDDSDDVDDPGDDDVDDGMEDDVEDEDDDDDDDDDDDEDDDDDDDDDEVLLFEAGVLRTRPPSEQPTRRHRLQRTACRKTKRATRGMSWRTTCEGEGEERPCAVPRGAYLRRSLVSVSEPERMVRSDSYTSSYG